MKIALYHDAVIPPPKYGGTERVMHWLCRGLQTLGHEVVLMAARGSHLERGEVIEIEDFEHWTRQLPSDVDFVHLWTTPRVPVPKPFVVTIGGIGKAGEKFHPNTVFVSRKHAELHGSRSFVHNGIDPADYYLSPQKENFAVFLAKASWNVKNLEGAIQVARAANMPLEVLGSRDWPLGLQRWLPRIGGVRYRGMVGDREKSEVLSRARALIFPVRWNEPFGLALTESLASGCFVLGTPYGSLPEIISPQVGQLSADASVLAQTLKNPPASFSPLACRTHVEKGGFTHLDMARSYVALYERVLEHGTLQATEPTLIASETARQGLLPWNSI